MSLVQTIPLLHQEIERWALATLSRHILAYKPTSCLDESLLFSESAKKRQARSLIWNNRDFSPKWSRPRKFRSKSSKTFDIRYEGWKYFHPSYLISTQKVKVNLIFNLFQKYEGFFHIKNGIPEISINAISSNLNVKLLNESPEKYSYLHFNEDMSHIRQVLHHELIHLSQSVLSDLVYSRTKKNPKNPPGNPLFSKAENNQESYYLYPEEFYPLLIECFHESKRVLQEENFYEPDETSRERFHRICCYGLYSNEDHRTFFLFPELRKNNYDRWKKAVREYYKYLCKEGL